MENKKDLVKIALAALILASATPVNGQADDRGADGIFLAVSCAAHGCPSVSSGADNTTRSGNVYDPNASNSSNNGYYNPNASATLTEAQLLNMLNTQGRTIYLNNLDPEAKALALQLANQDSYRDKNLAVKEAQRRMNERQNPNR